MSRYTKANHRIFMQFVRRDVWHVAFLEPGLQTPLPKKLTFKDEGKDQGVGTPRRGLADLRGPATAGLRNSEGRGRCLFEVVAWTVRTTETALSSQSPLVGREWHRSRETCGATRYRGLEKIREFARRGEAWGDSESRQMLEHAIDMGIRTPPGT
jgi:hypothetical protein